MYNRLLRRTAKTTIDDCLREIGESQTQQWADDHSVGQSDDTFGAIVDPATGSQAWPNHQTSSTGGVLASNEHLQTGFRTVALPQDTDIHSAPLKRFWEVPGSTPYEITAPVDWRLQDLIQPSHDPVPIGIADDPFFANESDDEEPWKNIREGGLPLKIKHDNRRYDKLHCPILTVVDTTGIHEIRVRFCRCQSLKVHPLQSQLMTMGMYTSSSKRTRTVFTFRVLHHFDITNLEAKTTAWQYYRTLQRLTSNVFTDTVADRYRELMRALRQWRDLASRRRAGQPLEPEVELKPGDLALFCPACPQPGINLPENWEHDTDQ